MCGRAASGCKLAARVVRAGMGGVSAAHSASDNESHLRWICLGRIRPHDPSSPGHSQCGSDVGLPLAFLDFSQFAHCTCGPAHLDRPINSSSPPLPMVRAPRHYPPPERSNQPHTHGAEMGWKRGPHNARYSCLRDDGFGGRLKGGCRCSGCLLRWVLGWSRACPSSSRISCARLFAPTVSGAP